MVAMAETGVKRIQHAGLISRLLSDISPDQAIRGIMLHGIQKKSASKRTFPHLIARSLLSVVLRAASKSEARSAKDSISILLCAPEEHDASALGFSPGQSTSVVANILIDMLSSAAQDEPLLLSGPTLSFYSEAGAGAGDTDEFHKATPEHRVAQAHSHEPLADIRQLNLAVAIHIFADAFRKKGCRKKLLEVARSNMHRILTPLLSILPSSISQLDSSLLEALFSFYDALFTALAEHERSDIITRLVSSIMQTIQTSPEDIFIFANGMSNNALKVSMCRLCLIQRFRVADDYSKPLTVRTLASKYLTLKPVKGRANKAVPVLLTVLINSWLQALPEEKLTFEFLGEEISRDVREIVTNIFLLRKKMVKRYTETLDVDMIAFKMAVFKLTHRILHAERKNGKLFAD